MISASVEIIAIALLTALSCTLSGVFLVLRGVAMMSDAISHAILLGIVVMFLVTGNLESPLLIIGAALSGVLTVIMTELIGKCGHVKKDAAIGLVFPLLFSCGVILISRYARMVHLDVDMVLLGEIAFAPFNRVVFAGVDCGPYALFIAAFSLISNLFLIVVLYRQFVVTIFDAAFSSMLSLSVSFFYYLLMIMTSVTAVAAFDVVGSVMVVALMITPSCTAYLLTRSIPSMIRLSMMIACVSVLSGYSFSLYADVSIAGSIVLMTGICFIVGLIAHNKNIHFY